MNFIKNHVRLFEVLFCVFSFVLAVLIAVYVVGVEKESVISSALGASDSRMETLESEDGEEEEIDSEYFKATYEKEADLISAYEQLCREVEEEGIVLLKNDNGALPLNKGAKVSLFGQGSADFNYNTSGSSSSGSTSSYATLRGALEEDERLEVNPTLWEFYQSSAYQAYSRSYDSSKGYLVNEAPYSIYPSDVIGTYKSYGDAAIVTLSRDSGEGKDIDAGGDGTNYLVLSDEEKDLLVNLKSEKDKGNFSSIVVLLNTSAEVQLDFLYDESYGVDACLWVGNTGSHGAYAIGEVLTGEVNPSGKSVDTYLKNNFSSPAMANWSSNDRAIFSQRYSNYSAAGLGTTNSYYGVYVEGIYVGYRYFETRYEDYVLGSANVGTFDYGSDVAYPFGYGLSYTTFDYDDFNVAESEDGESYDVSVTVTNSGDVPGKEIVEIYLQKPYNDYDKSNNVEKASVELVGYAKTETIQPEDSAEVTVTVQKEQFKSYDSYGAKTYILDYGDYYLTAAHDSHDAVNNILAAKNAAGVSVSTDKMDASGDATMAAVAYTLDGTSPDVDTYSVSTETGEPITNQLDDSDMNLYSHKGDNSVTYVSRSNWSGTFPKGNITFTVNDAMADDLQSDVKEYDQSGYKKPTYGKKGGMSLMMLSNLGTGTVSETQEEIDESETAEAEDAWITYDDDRWDDLLDQMTYAEQSNMVVDGYHLTHASSTVNKPATKDENGPTQVNGSITGYCLPSEGIWAATFNDELIERIGNLFGDDSRMANPQVHGLYAPGVNIHRTGYCGRSHEYFSEDPYLSGMASVAEIKGMQDRGVIAYVKHFAFNDEERNRNGIGIWLNEQSAREIYLLPFEYSMRPSMGNAHASMTSFNRAGCTWTGADSHLLEDIARGEWNYEGFYITDSLGEGSDYMTYYDGIMNGTSLYDGQGTESSLDAYKNNNRFCYMLREACHRILYNVGNYSSAMNGMTANSIIITFTPWWLVLVIVLLVIAAVGTAAALVFYVLAEVFKWMAKKKDNGDDGGGAEVQEDQTDSSGGAAPSSDLE